MCSSWKFVGVAALSFSLFYNCIALIIAITFVLRCYDDCDGDQPGEYPEDCYASFAIYQIYLPTVFATPFIRVTDRSSIYHLQWWLLIQAVLTFCSYLIYLCYRPFYTPFYSDINMVGVAALVFSFGVVAYHFFKLYRTPPEKANQNTPEETA